MEAFLSGKSGSVVTWGPQAAGGYGSNPDFGANDGPDVGDLTRSQWVAQELSSDVKEVFSTDFAFAALKTDGSVITWGGDVDLDGELNRYTDSGGSSYEVADQISSGVSTIYSNAGAFAALKNDGSVVTWGPQAAGGYGSNPDFGANDGPDVGDLTRSQWVAQELSSDVKEVFSTDFAFAALKTDGSVITWGGDVDLDGGLNRYTDSGGSSYEVADQISSGVSTIYSNAGAFAALKNDGSVVTWGPQAAGGYGSNPDFGANDGPDVGDLTRSQWVAQELSSDVKEVFSTDFAFAALKTDGSVITWGGDVDLDGELNRYTDSGGSSHEVADQISSGVSTIYSNAGAFAALKNDGSVVTWGPQAAGGYGSNPDFGANDGPDVGDLTRSQWVAQELSSDVKEVFSTDFAFAALKTDGSVITWGGDVDLDGGLNRYTDSGGSSYEVADQISSGVSTIYSNAGAFAALKNDGSVVTWGPQAAGGYGSNPDFGANDGPDVGDLTRSQWVAQELSSDVKEVFSTDFAFAALKTDGSVITWGGDVDLDGELNRYTDSGGSSHEVADQISSGVSTIYSNAGAFAALKYDFTEIHLFDFELNYQLNSATETELSQNAVLGDSIDESAIYTLEITGDSLRDGYRVESADITLSFDTVLFNDIQASDIRIGGAMPIANAVAIDNEAGTIRIAASSLSDLASGTGIDGETVLASINLDFDETALATIAKNLDGSLKTNPLSFSLSANSEETIFSKNFIDATGQLNRDIVSLNDLGGYVAVEGQDVTLYEAKVNLAQLGDGLVLGTQRVIGSDASTTNLVRSGDTLTTSTEWLNVGNIQASNLSYESVYNQNASLVSADFSKSNIASGSFIDGVFVQVARESTVLTTDIKITGEAGNVVDLGDGIVSVKADAEGSDSFSNAGKGSSNLITFQGDLNYDGRVSMKDLAYLNAGAARQQLIESTDENGIAVQVASEASYARDVDADFSGKIDLADLSVLDADWGKSLHVGDQDFQGSADVSWNDLDNQGTSSIWENDSFKDQNAIEAEDSYVGSLESPTSTGVIGADGNTTANDNDITGTEFQDSIPV